MYVLKNFQFHGASPFFLGFLSENPFKGKAPLFNFTQLIIHYQITLEIETITRQIIRKYRPIKIILFGSAGREEYDLVK